MAACRQVSGKRQRLTRPGPLGTELDGPGSCAQGFADPLLQIVVGQASTVGNDDELQGAGQFPDVMWACGRQSCLPAASRRTCIRARLCSARERVKMWDPSGRATK